MWDAKQYLKFSQERSRPFCDLVAQIQHEKVRRIADLGCGPGNLTRTLADRWPEAIIVGVDHSPEMLKQAKELAIPGRLSFVQGDISAWSSDKPLDLIISNAVLVWVADHDRLLPHLAKQLAAGGTLAVQMPSHFQTPAHRAVEETIQSQRWRNLQGLGLQPDAVKPLLWYVEQLHRLGLVVNAWETRYIHVLRGDNPVLEWLKGTALRPFLNQLTDDESEDFLGDLGERLRAAYTPTGGATLFSFPRIFFVATRTSTPSCA